MAAVAEMAAVATAAERGFQLAENCHSALGRFAGSSGSN